MKAGDRVVVTEPACVEEICDAFGTGRNVYRIYPGGWFPKEELTPVASDKIDLWRVKHGSSIVNLDDEAEARELAARFVGATVQRLIAFKVKKTQ